MDELKRTLAALGLSWGDVWALTADRRAGTLVVVARDGRKLTARLETPETRSLTAANPRRVKVVKAAD